MLTLLPARKAEQLYHQATDLPRRDIQHLRLRLDLYLARTATKPGAMGEARVPEPLTIPAYKKTRKPHWPRIAAVTIAVTAGLALWAYASQGDAAWQAYEAHSEAWRRANDNPPRAMGEARVPHAVWIEQTR